MTRRQKLNGKNVREKWPGTLFVPAAAALTRQGYHLLFVASVSSASLSLWCWLLPWRFSAACPRAVPTDGKKGLC